MKKPKGKKERDFRNDVIDADYLLEAGLLFEINRQFLHPLGLAITVKVDPEGGKTWAFKDLRVEPEKMVFDRATLLAGRLKLETFLKRFGFAQMERRVKKLGQSVQHVEAWVGGK